ncbi:MAG: hypothetical protein JW973_10350 [Bacteroidales bacterium]|nr:hypothetical protein [Bacteroidales bacterium]
MTGTRFCFFLLSLTAFFISLPVMAQNEPPPGLHLQKISTPAFNIVFPRGLENKAFQVASLMDYVSGKVPDIYNLKTKKINLYLNNQSVIANGYVTLAPRYMQWYLHAPQDVTQTGGTDWLKLLSVHEYRHVVQFDYLKRNFALLPSTLFGQLGQTFVALWAVPQWYYEGDAISAETILTNTGRGRLPEFEMETKAILTGHQKRFTYNQAYLRSYRRYFPNHYYLGYFMYTHVARNYGLNTWPDVIEKVTHTAFSPFAFSKGLKKYTGNNLTRTYRNTMEELKYIWKAESFTMPPEITAVKTSFNKVYTHYKYGHRLEDGSLVCMKYGMAVPPRLINVSADGREKILRGINNDMYISSNGQILAWLTLTPDKRWGMRDYSDIMVMDVRNDKIRKLTRKGKYGSLSVSPKGDKIAAVRYNDTVSCSIDIIDLNHGNTLDEFHFPAYSSVRTPAWSEDESMLVYAATADSVISLNLLDLRNGESKNLLKTTAENISKPVFWNDFILFGTSVRGKNEIHALSLSTDQRYIALTGGHGFFNPTSACNDEEVIVEGYTEEGYRLYSWKPDRNKFTAFSRWRPAEYYITPVVEKGNYKDIFLESIPDKTDYRIRKYHHFTDGLRLHSWAILPSYQGIEGALFLNDPLSVFGVTAGIQYNQNEKNTNEYLSFSYSGIYPRLSAGVSTGNRTMLKEYGRDSSEYFQWHENAIMALVTLPFNLTREAFLQTMNVTADYQYIMVSDLDHTFKDDYTLGNGTLSAAGLFLSWTGYRQMASRDFYPSLGFMLNTSYQRSVAGSDFNSHLLSVSLTGYFRGIARHHSIRVHAAYETQNIAPDPDEVYLFPSKILYFRGYEPRAKEELTLFSVDYALPLCYPDLGIGSIVYLKRIRTNLFADFGTGKDAIINKTYFSSGIDLLFDVNVFRLLAEIDLGIRVAVTRNKVVSAEFIYFQRFGY